MAERIVEGIVDNAVKGAEPPMPRSFFRRCCWCYREGGALPPLSLLWHGAAVEIHAWQKTRVQAEKVARWRNTEVGMENRRGIRYEWDWFGMFLLAALLSLVLGALFLFQERDDANPERLKTKAPIPVVSVETSNASPSEPNVSMVGVTESALDDPALSSVEALARSAPPVAVAPTVSIQDQMISPPPTVDVPHAAEVARLVGELKRGRQRFERIGVQLYDKRTQHGVNFQETKIGVRAEEFLCSRGVQFLEERLASQQRLALAAPELIKYRDETEKSLESLKIWCMENCQKR